MSEKQIEKKISVDVGYGNVKIYDGKSLGGFPSVYKRCIDDYVPKTSEDDMLLELYEKKYFVGLSALRQGGMSPFNRDDMLRHKIFTLSAVCWFTKGNFEGKVLLGLPIMDVSSIKKNLYSLRGEYEVKWNGKKRNIKITGVSVFAQSEAVFNLLVKQDPSIREKIIGIVDVGQKTVDVAYFEEGSYIRDRSTSYDDVGVISAYQQIATAVADKYGFKIEDYKARKYIRKVQPQANQAFEAMASKIKDNLFRLRWNFNELDELYIIGGGADFIAPYFGDAPVKPLKDAVFANARSYYEADMR